MFLESRNNIILPMRYFRFFNYQWLAGSADNALDEPGKVVLPKAGPAPIFLFGNTNAIGQTILYNDSVKAS